MDDQSFQQTKPADQSCSMKNPPVTGINPSLNLIFDNSHDSIYVTDRFGTVLLVNPAGCRLLQLPQEEIVGANVKDLVKAGVYHYSTAMEAAAKRTVVTGLVKTRHGLNLMSTSAPLLDDEGNVIMVITNSRDKDAVDKFIAALEQERELANRYKSAVEYLGTWNQNKEQLIAESPAMRAVVMQAKMVAKVDSTTVIFGESGTGKEVVAKYIHRNSQRAKEPFIPVNCAAIPRELLESEFFGYAKGAFTGANVRGKPGFFEMADKGTLFLDEIGELPLPLQSKLLRVLETGEIQRVGGTTVQHTDVRILAATHRDLKQMVKQGLCRQDLYYRLNVVPVYIPPLRERPEDIAALAKKFLDDYNKKYGFQKYFAPTVIDGFIQYAWPGNVRELRNVVERMIITSPADELLYNQEWGYIGQEMGQAAQARPQALQQGSLKDVLEQVEAEYIHRILAECEGKVAQAAERLGIHRTVLYRKLRKKDCAIF